MSNNIMMNLLTKSFLLISILFNFSCCKKDTAVIYNSEFSNKTGNWWKYVVYDSIINRIDTVTIIIAGDTKIDNGLDTKMWVTKSWIHSSEVDTNFVNSSNEGIKIYSDSYSARFEKNYVFPLSIGNTWVGSFTGEIYSVPTSGTISVQVNSYSNCFNIKRDWYQLNTRVKESEWFLPNVGVIKRSYEKVSVSVNISQYWELFSYHLN